MTSGGTCIQFKSKSNAVVAAAVCVAVVVCFCIVPTGKSYATGISTYFVTATFFFFHERGLFDINITGKTQHRNHNSVSKQTRDKVAA